MSGALLRLTGSDAKEQQKHKNKAFIKRNKEINTKIDRKEKSATRTATE